MAPATILSPANCTLPTGASWLPAFEELREQWLQPSDVFSVLLLLGGDIINRALAQLAGGRLTPVTFSFGWASYAITLLHACVGDAKLMPISTDGPCLMIHGESGYTRSNLSWVVGRLMRDYELWMDKAVQQKLDAILEERYRYLQARTKQGTVISRPDQTGLCIAVYEPEVGRTPGKPHADFIHWTGLLVVAIQLLVSAIPAITSWDLSILVITIAGSVLAFATGSLTQWKLEKWNCRRASRSTYIITPGNGAQHAIVVLGNGHGLNLEDLATSGQMKSLKCGLHTRLCLGAISLLWICLLITAAGVKTHTWYLLAVGGIGVVQNVIVAGWRRTPEAHGVPLVFREVFGEMETMKSLLAVEKSHPNIGRVLLPIFFPGKLRQEEVIAWDQLTQSQTTPSNQSQNSGSAVVGAMKSWESYAKSFEKA